MKTATLSQTNRSLWILNPTWDMFLFVLTPVWIIPLIWGIREKADMNIVGTIILAIAATGHHMPGMIRAYTDPQLFRRYHWRFILSPIFFLSVCMAFAWFDLHGLFLILLLWGAWHGAMQTNGFLRIYDSKVGSISPGTARLDWAMCLTWFAGGLLHSSTKMTATLAFLYQSGGPLIPPESVFLFRHLWDIFTILVTAAFAINAWRQTQRGTPPNPVKFLAMASIFGFWWFSVVLINDVLLSVLLFEILHDLQYSALVWVYNKGRVAQNLATSRVEKFIFRPGWIRMAFYAMLIAAYGYFGLAMGYVNSSSPKLLGSASDSSRFLINLIVASAFLHFYFDGFIWRVREGGLRKGLGIQDAKKAVVEKASFNWLSSSLRWSLFVVPVFVLGFTEYYGHSQLTMQHYENMIRIIPDNWHLDFVMGAMESDETKAISYLKTSVELKPDFAPSQKMLAELYDEHGAADSAYKHYRLAAALNPWDKEVQDSLESLKKQTSH